MIELVRKARQPKRCSKKDWRESKKEKTQQKGREEEIDHPWSQPCNVH